MKTLPINEPFKVHGQSGWTFKILKREGRVALVEKTKGPQTRYEVVVIQIERARQLNGIDYTDRETMPSSEQWGGYGWSPYDLKEAHEVFSEWAAKWSEKGKSGVLETQPDIG